MPDRRPAVIVMVKVPRAGRVKTRLGRDIGMIPAAWWFRHRVAGLMRDIADPRWRIVLAVSPDHEGLSFRRWPPHLHRVAQGRGDLGQRMARAFRASGPGPAVLIGADVPGVTRGHVQEAFRALGRADAVIGPATDGGYWLVGFRHCGRLPAGAFADVRWSGPNALSDTMASLRGQRLAFVQRLSDVDTHEDLCDALRR